MNRSKVAGIVGLVGALAVSGYGQGVVAQARLTIGGGSANYGVRTVNPGFVPDPIRINVTSGGNIDVSTLNLGAGCVGHVTAQPDFIMRLSGQSAAMRVYVSVPNAQPNSRTDTTLVINTAAGGWVCNDDSSFNANPMIDLDNAAPGQYDIWVGSYTTAQVRGTLNITEVRSNHP